jgi:hypothetical protein
LGHPELLRKSLDNASLRDQVPSQVMERCARLSPEYSSSPSPCHITYAQNIMFRFGACLGYERDGCGWGRYGVFEEMHRQIAESGCQVPDASTAGGGPHAVLFGVKRPLLA